MLIKNNDTTIKWSLKQNIPKTATTLTYLEFPRDLMGNLDIRISSHDKVASCNCPEMTANMIYLCGNNFSANKITLSHDPRAYSSIYRLQTALNLLNKIYIPEIRRGERSPS